MENYQLTQQFPLSSRGRLNNFQLIVFVIESTAVLFLSFTLTAFISVVCNSGIQLFSFKKSSDKPNVPYLHPPTTSAKRQ